MPDAANVSAEAIASLLTGLAGALSDAQVQMSEQPPVDAYGRSMPVYQIPHLDFEFEIETVRQSSDTAEVGRLMLRPASNTSARDKISSTIRGRLVAVPASGVPQVQISIDQTDDGLHIVLSNSAGETLANTPVEFELDAAASEALYDTTLNAADRLTLLDRQVVVTNAKGQASATVQRSSIPSGKSVVIVVRSGRTAVRTTVARDVAK